MSPDKPSDGAVALDESCEVRMAGDKLDEVVGYGEFHLEEMHAGHWFLSLGDVAVWLSCKGKMTVSFERRLATQRDKRAGHVCDPANREAGMVWVTDKAFCDPCIADLVAALNAGGIATVASCCGHGTINGNIALVDGRELLIAESYEQARDMERTLATPRDTQAGKPCELADDLAMFATMIREAANGQGELPNIWHIDDWLTRYRSSLTRSAERHSP